MRAFGPLVVALVFTMSACGGCGPRTVVNQPERVGERGESCRARNDCEEGLACVRGTCVKNEYAIDQAGGNCVLVECTEDEDCCDPPSQCASLEEDCNGGDEFACDQFDNLCTCEFECSDNQCRSIADPCEDDVDCFGNICDDGVCVECANADDCFGDEMCIDGFCDEGCETDANCPLFNTCQEGECVETGCQSDRECVLFTEDGDAVCQDGQCNIPCVSDAECNAGDFGQFEICEGGRCVFIGCETDSECRVALGLSNTNGAEAAVCESGGM
jgi:hypothetical protein